MTLAGPPVAALNIWLSGIAERQARQELDLTARRSMTLAEDRMERALGVLDNLASRGIDSCRPSHIEALRIATFGVAPVKELSVVAADGRTLCTDVGHLPEARQVVFSEPLLPGKSIKFEIVRLAGRSGQWVRILRPGEGLGNGLAALVPADLFVAKVSIRGGPPVIHVSMLTASGTLISEAGPAAAASNGMIATELQSARFPLKATWLSRATGLLAVGMI